MNKRAKSLVILLSATTVVAALILVRPLLQKEEEIEEDTILYVRTLERQDIVRVTVEPSGLVFVREKKEGEEGLGEWKFAGETPYAIDNSEVTSRCYSLTNLRADRLLEENTQDLAKYGLDTPRASVLLEDKNGNTERILLGDLSPAGNTYYAMREGDSAVYTIPKYMGDAFLITLDDIRDKHLASIDSSKLKYLLLERKGAAPIEIQPTTQEDRIFAPLNTYKLTKPLAYWIAIDPQKFEDFILPVTGIMIQEFTDLTPEKVNLVDPPYHLLVEGEDETLDLYIGSQLPDGRYYARRPESHEVFVIKDISRVLTASPFDFIDTMIFLVNIDNVESFSIMASDVTYEAKIERVAKPAPTPSPTPGASPASSPTPTPTPEVEEHFYLNGKEIEEKAFRQFYQKCVGIAGDSPNPAPDITGKPEVVISYRFDETLGHKSEQIAFIPYDEEFYAAQRRGKAYFLVSRRQIEALLEAAEETLTHQVVRAEEAGS